MTAGDPNGPQATQETQAPTPLSVESRRYRWYHKLSAVLLVTFCLEIGFFLLIFPWTDYWGINYFSSLGASWRSFWSNPYLRGAVSGLGIATLYVAMAEIFRLRRFSGRR